ncbi:phage tail domain-containing protein [Staphylococcus xylosus]|uniref:phage tail domain-containing protein n=1 Tax=Staphylococcus xylosus TaxID=1288 RepID=UPI001C3EAA56|nr:phage tail domain-containing protein [Staphylococcus xylosus]
MERWVKIIDEKHEETVSGDTGFFFLDAEVEYPNAVDNDITMDGIDGTIPGYVTYAPFNLILRFGFDGEDLTDKHIFEHHLRAKFCRRKPFYVITSQLPNIKYSVNRAQVNPTLKPDGTSIEFEVTFNVYKGYSESVFTTRNIADFGSDWGVENSFPLNENIKYYHIKNQFTIWNGSNDIIKPQFGHQLNIKLNVQSNGGFELVNLTTGDIFKYKKSSTKNTNIVLNSIYAYRENYRCGIDTNRGVITLDPGYNEFKIKGEVGSCSSEFDFPFIYR